MQIRAIFAQLHAKMALILEFLRKIPSEIQVEIWNNFMYT